MPYFEHCGAKLHYEEKGVGKALIFLHGAAWDLRQWDRQMEVFSSHYRVIAIDARCHGKSTLPPGEVSPSIVWQDVQAELLQMQSRKAMRRQRQPEQKRRAEKKI